MDKRKAKVNAAHALRKHFATYAPFEKIISVQTFIHANVKGIEDTVSGRCVTVNYDDSRVCLYYYWYDIIKGEITKVTYLDSM